MSLHPSPPLAVLVARLEHELETLRFEPQTPTGRDALARATRILEQIRNHSDLGGRA